MTAASSVLIILIFVGVFTQIASANVLLECLNLFFCDGETPVCSSNGTHCWHSDNDCERSQFNCFQFSQNDFDTVVLNYCKGLTLGGIKPCCIEKTCPNKSEPICGQTKTVLTISKCKWFKNRCTMENANCESGKDFIEVSKDLCNFDIDSDERYCSKASDATGSGLT